MEKLFGKTTPSVVKTPFLSKHIREISMHAAKNRFFEDADFEFFGYVEFKNGQTEGTQRFRANNLGELYEKIANFCMTL